MIILIDTSAGICKTSLIRNDRRIEDEWQADRDLAKHLLKHLHELLSSNSFDWSDVSAIGVYTGPGSFTGLRIGMTVMNSLADALDVPIIGATGDNWQEVVLNRLKNNENDNILIPNYGSDAKITTPKK